MEDSRWRRPFAGWDFGAGDAAAPDLAAIGYGKGVPMGGELGAAPAGAYTSPIWFTPQQ